MHKNGNIIDLDETTTLENRSVNQSDTYSITETKISHHFGQLFNKLLGP